MAMENATGSSKRFGKALAIGAAALGVAAISITWFCTNGQAPGGIRFTDAPRSDADFQANIAKAKSSGDNARLMDQEYRYAEWLATDKRALDAIPHYQAAEDLAKNQGLTDWQAISMARQQRAAHLAFASGTGPAPDAGKVEEAIRLTESAKQPKWKRNKAKYLTELALIYADNKQLDKAANAAGEAAEIFDALKAKDNQAEALLTKAIVLSSANKDKEALAAAVQGTMLAPGHYRKLAAEVQDAFAKHEKSDWDGVQEQSATLLAKGDYDGLEQLAAKLDTVKAPDASNVLPIELFQRGLLVSDGAAEEKWQKRIQELGAWLKAKPGSIHAGAALGRVYVNYAWEARGNGYSDTVSQEGWAKFNARLQDASSILSKVEKPALTVDWIDAWQGAALGLGTERPVYDAMVAKFIKQFPEVPAIYRNQGWYLQPRWHGETGEWDKVLNKECDALGATKGDIMYARVVGQLSRLINDVFADGANWPRTKRGLEALIKKYPDSFALKFRMARLAATAGDNATVVAMSK